MATTIQLAVTLDPSGAILGVKQLGDGLNKIPPPSPRVRQEFDGIAEAEERAHIAGELFARLTGLELPRSMESVIAKSSTLGPMLEKIFNPVLAATAGAAMIEFGKQAVESLGNLFESLAGNTEAIKTMGKAAADAAQDAFWNPKNLTDATSHLAQLRQQVSALQQVSSFKQPVSAFKVAPEVKAEADLQQIEQKRNDLLENMNKLQQQKNALLDEEEAKANEAGKLGFTLLEQQKQDFLNSRQMLVMKVQDNQQYTETVTNYERQYQGERMALERASTNETLALRHQVEIESVQGTARILAQQHASLDDIDTKERETLITTKDAETQRALVYQRTNDQLRQSALDLQKLWDENNIAIEQRSAKYLKGSAQIIAEGKIEIDTLEAQRRDLESRYAPLDQERLAGEERINKMEAASAQETNTRLLLYRKQLTEQTIDLEQQAAIASLPEWQRAEAQIRLEHQKTYQQLNELELLDTANFAVYEQQKAAADQLMNAKLLDAHKQLVEQVGSDFSSLFDDIANGNLGKRILSNIEKLFGQIVAQWFLSIGIMKSTAGALFGSVLFGPGSSTSNILGGGSLINGLFGGSTSSLAAPQIPTGIGTTSSALLSPGAFSLAGSGGSTSLNLPGLGVGTGFGTGVSSSILGSGLGSAIAGTTATTSGALVPSASNALTTSTMSQALNLPGLSAGGGFTSAATNTVSTATAKSGLFGNLFNTKTLTALGPIAAMLAGAFGGKIGQAGGLLTASTFTLLPQLLSKLGVSGAVAPLILGPLAFAGAGLSAFGLGQQNGGLIGGLGGAGEGALTGFLVGGPIGAVVGGIIGLLGGIFGGIFGGNKRKKQANAYFDNTVTPDITQITQGFDSFQIDSGSAIQQLEQLRTDAQTQLKALKSQGNDVFNEKVVPAINDAEQHINSIQTQRDSRSATVFGPPQFDTGGMFSVSGNAGLAVLHNGEFVVNPTATKKNLPALAAMNAGGNAGMMSMGDLHIHPATLNRAYVRSRQFRKDISDAITQARIEGMKI